MNELASLWEEKIGRTLPRVTVSEDDLLAAARGKLIPTSQFFVPFFFPRIHLQLETPTHAPHAGNYIYIYIYHSPDTNGIYVSEWL